MITDGKLKYNQDLVVYFTNVIQLQPNKEIPFLIAFLLTEHFLGIYEENRKIFTHEKNTLKRWLCSVGFTVIENKEGMLVVR